MSRFEALPQTIVMVVEGAAYGGGLGLMCGGDVVLAAADAKFSISETTLGVPPAQIAPFVAQRIGVARTRRLSLTAHRFDGREAERIGLVDMACDGTAALDAALAQVLAGHHAAARRMRNAVTKRLHPREPHDAARGIARAVGRRLRRMPARSGGAGGRHGVPAKAQDRNGWKADMSLAGQAVVAIWNGIAPEGRTEFYEWHNREHMPERVGIPGFRRGRRYIAKYGTPEYLHAL